MNKVKAIYFTSKKLEKLCFEIQYIRVNITKTLVSNIHTLRKKQTYVGGPENKRDKKGSE